MPAPISAHAYPERYHSIDAAERSMLFLATLHGGSKGENIESLLSHVASLAFQSPSKRFLKTLKHESDTFSIITRVPGDPLLLRHCQLL